MTKTNIRPVNGQTEIRQRGSEGCYILDCGCAHTDTKWLQFCDKHWSGWVELHKRAADAHPVNAA